MNRIYILFIVSIFSFSCNAQNEYRDVVLETTKGTIKLELYDNTFRHSENFLKLVKDGYYDGQLFHRVINNFMIQAGDDKSIDADPGVSLGHGGKDYTIPAEFFPEYYHVKGALAAARQSDNVNPKKESSGSQFYIVKGAPLSKEKLELVQNRYDHPRFSKKQIEEYTTLGGTPHLDYAYTVFGRVIEGLDIIDSISVVKTDKRNRPIEDIKIIKAYTVKNKK